MKIPKGFFVDLVASTLCNLSRKISGASEVYFSRPLSVERLRVSRHRDTTFLLTFFLLFFPSSTTCTYGLWFLLSRGSSLIYRECFSPPCNPIVKKLISIQQILKIVSMRNFSIKFSGSFLFFADFESLNYIYRILAKFISRARSQGLFDSIDRTRLVIRVNVMALELTNEGVNGPKRRQTLVILV